MARDPDVRPAGPLKRDLSAGRSRGPAWLRWNLTCLLLAALRARRQDSGESRSSLHLWKVWVAVGALAATRLAHAHDPGSETTANAASSSRARCNSVTYTPPPLGPGVPGRRIRIRPGEAISSHHRLGSAAASREVTAAPPMTGACWSTRRSPLERHQPTGDDSGSDARTDPGKRGNEEHRTRGRGESRLEDDRGRCFWRRN